ncbi:hypothetical protein [Bartonella sp. DGB2]|uniref:hypothetical protein n=1 Tax=Bartonella sp. DGB2 TaxID=3388426 RepID=UPI00398FF17C
MLAIEKQAQSLGARFNAQAAIDKRLSVEQAQQHVLDALVEASCSKTISPYANTSAGEISQSKKLSIWKWKKRESVEWQMFFMKGAARAPISLATISTFPVKASPLPREIK